MKCFDALVLIGKSYAVDNIGQYKPVEAKRTVYPYKVESASQSEYFEAGRIGFKPDYKVVLSVAQDYHGEDLCEYNGKRYAIYRTYQDGEMMELYLRREAGEADDAKQ